MTKVEYVSHMGNDLFVANAARKSFGVDFTEFRTNEDGPRSPRGRSDEQLIIDLVKDGHWLPFRHPHITFSCSSELPVARQLGKHQIGLCLSGDTEVTFVKKVKGTSNGTFTKSLNYIADMWFGKIKYQGGLKGKLNITNSHIRVFNENTQRFETSHITNVIDSGIKDVFKITDNYGNTLKATENHQLLTDSGWKELKDITLSDKLIRSDMGETFARTEPRYNNWEDKQGITGSTTLLPKYVEIFSIEFVGQEQCYDISVDTIHNFIGNGFVVHNCWSEISRRYKTKDIAFTYLGDTWRLDMKDRKQGTGEIAPDELQEKLKVIQSNNIKNSLTDYEKALELGAAPEQARYLLPQSMNAEWTWTGSLLAWAHMYKQRNHPDAQKECTEFVLQVSDVLYKLYPYSWKALVGDIK